MISTQRFAKCSPREVRLAIRAGELAGPTAGMAEGFAQANVVIVGSRWADDFEQFCHRNARACPLIARTAPGDPFPREVAADGDLRTDVPRYRVFRDGLGEPSEPTEVAGLWRDDLVGFLLGCSFTFEWALVEAGLRVRHLDLGRNVPMYRTNVACAPAGAFAGPLVVSMRPFAPGDVDLAIAISGEFPSMHGAPIHVGDPGALGIADLSRPDFGDAVTIHRGEVPLFWACGVTPQLALAAARPELAITHSPGCMFVTDRPERSFRSGARSGN